ncbi:MAG: sigma-70 family RNA polymerase sigma factor [Clostridia bacterium]|nr:sigma-70 family RNA polymerase sigma factor [Clostridia bacterium]
MNALLTGLNDLSDEELAVLARDKNEEAFTRLVSRCSGMLQALSTKYSLGSLESDDLVQEGLLGLMSAVQTYCPSADVTFRTYAYACARNRMISALRRRSGVEATSLDDEDEPLFSSGSDDPASLLVRQEELQQLRERLRAGLSSLEYHVLMAYLSGFSYREIAQRLDITEKAVDNARQRLRRKLAPSLFLL